MSRFVKVKDTGGNIVFLHPDHVTCVAQRDGGIVDIIIVTGGTVTVEGQVDQIVAQIERMQA